jgi:hypothetical protein
MGCPRKMTLPSRSIEITFAYGKKRLRGKIKAYVEIGRKPYYTPEHKAAVLKSMERRA